MGPQASIVGGVLGGILGTFAGLLSSGMLALTGKILFLNAFINLLICNVDESLIIIIF